MSAADPMAGPSWFAADLVVMDPNEGADAAEFDLLDIGEGYTLGLSVSMRFAQCLSLNYLPITHKYQVLRFTKISQAFHLGPTGFLDNNEGGQRTLRR